MNRISESSTLAARAYESFQTMLNHSLKASKLSGLELIEEVETHVDRFKVASYEHALLDELVRRYEKAASVVRPEEEFPEPTEADLAEVEAIEKEMEAEKDRVLYYVIRFHDGLFYSRDEAPVPVPSLSEATHYSTREEAEMIALTDATVVEVTP